jgi:hypothetical protein
MTTRISLTIRIALALIASVFVGLGLANLYQVSPNQRQIEHGRKLVTLGGCNDCHTTMKQDPKLGLPVPRYDVALSGHPQDAPGPTSTLVGSDQAVFGPTSTSFRVPFGTVYAANLTPDRETGLGAWNERLLAASHRGTRVVTLRFSSRTTRLDARA